MEQEQSHFLFGRKVTGQFAAFSAVIFSIALTAFIACIYVGFELNLTLIIFVIVANVLVTFVWLLGIFKDKREFMLFSLIFWGALLDIWLGYIFLITIESIPYGPDLYRKHTTAEIVIPSITVLFVLYYIWLMLIYKSMGKDIRKIFRMDWQMSGILYGGVMISLTLGQTLLFHLQRLQSDFYFYGTILYIVFNSIAAISWLYAIAKKKQMFVLSALVCWLVPLSIWIGLVIYGITEKGFNPGNRKNGHNIIYPVSIFTVIVYVAACYTFKSINSNESESDRFNIAYAPPPTARRKFDA
ncbi:uncharacterized protein LOC129570772 [Sitodiplosis mosellana]|uniref:uncharacterized protein LOC129570772 n=1 Tax=Sitodiplosis mosellana TaxID=263140 RepID=UPI0024441769|nr:uncharacterized protein LOC129570772 [Sitodiplosis mosellana]